MRINLKYPVKITIKGKEYDLPVGVQEVPDEVGNFPYIKKLSIPQLLPLRVARVRARLPTAKPANKAAPKKDARPGSGPPRNSSRKKS